MRIYDIQNRISACIYCQTAFMLLVKSPTIFTVYSEPPKNFFFTNQVFHNNEYFEISESESGVRFFKFNMPDICVAYNIFVNLWVLIPMGIIVRNMIKDNRANQAIFIKIFKKSVALFELEE